jgi:hypothetical protein
MARFLAALVLAAALVAARTPAQTDVSDAALEKASEGRTVDIGLLSAGGGPLITDNATLYLPVDASLAEIEPGGVVSQFIGTEHTLRSFVD